MKKLLLVFFILLPTLVFGQATLGVTFAWDASPDGPGPTTNPVKYKLCTTVTTPSAWPVGALPTDRLCTDAGVALEQRIQLPVGTRFVFATAYNLGVSSDGTLDPNYIQESGSSNVLRVEVFAPPGQPNRIRLKSVTQAQSTISGQILQAKR